MKYLICFFFSFCFTFFAFGQLGNWGPVENWTVGSASIALFTQAGSVTPANFLNTSEVAYCTPAPNTTYHFYISGVSFENINNINQWDDKKSQSQSPAGYRNFTNFTTDVNAGATYPITINHKSNGQGGPKTDYVFIWIDFNQNDSFEANELVGQMNKLVEAYTTYTSTTSISIPSSATPGNTRMRIIQRRDSAPSSCSSGGKGEAEDYTINIIGGSDTTDPIPTITTNSDPVFGPFQIDVDFDESVTGLSSLDFTVNNGAISNLTGSGLNYSVQITPTAIGSVQITLPAGSVVDGAGNANVAATLSVSYQSCPDDDGDGVCNDQDVCPNGPEPGTPCDDQNANTINDVVGTNCICTGMPPPSNETNCFSIDNSIDDIREASQGWVQTDGDDLKIGEHQIGLRFNNILIPNGANISEAEIQFKSFQTNTGAASLTITGQLIGNAPAFTSDRYALSSRNIRTASVTWSPQPWNNGDLTAAQKTVNIASIINELISQNDFVSGNSIVIFIEGTGTRVARAYDSASTDAAELCVTYGGNTCPDDDGDGVCNDQDSCPNGPEPGTICDDNDSTTFNDVIGANCICSGTSLPGSNETVCLRIDNGIDDIREQNQGWVKTDGDDLRLGEHQIGLRFNNVTISNGANILNAEIQFKSFQTNTGTASLTITGQLIGDAPVFTGGQYALSSRNNRTASVTWSPPSWNNGDLTDAQKTVDISSIITELVNQNDFVSGNSIAIFIEGSGSGYRVAEAFEKDDLNAAELCIIYRGPSVSTPDTRTYTKLKKELDGSYVQLGCASNLAFQYIEDYAITQGENAVIECKLFNWQREPIYTKSLVNNYGVNWKSINLRDNTDPNAFTPLSANTFYTLEVSGANKGEKYRLRVKTAVQVPCRDIPIN